MKKSSCKNRYLAQNGTIKRNRENRGASLRKNMISSGKGSKVGRHWAHVLL